MKKYLILVAAFIFFAGAGTTFAAKPVVKSAVTNDNVSITVECSECIKDTPGYVRITNRTGGAKQEKNFTNLNKSKSLNVLFSNLQLGRTYDILVASTGTEAAGNAYLYDLNGNGKTTFNSSFTTPINQTGGGSGTNNSTPLKVDIVKEPTKATISITCYDQCNGLKGDFTLISANYTKTLKGITLATGKTTKLVFDGLTANQTYKLNGNPALPDGTPYKFPETTFILDGNNQGPQTVNTDIQDINAQQYGGDVTSTTYTLLAPIDGTKTIETTSIGDYFNKIFMIAIGLCAALAVIMLVINGIKYMTSESFTEKSELKKDMGGPILGLIIALGAFALLNTIDPALTGKNGLTVDSVNADIDENEIPILSDEGTKLPPTGRVAKCPEGVEQVSTATVKFIACKSMSNKLKNLIIDAKAQGITLTGGGFRTYEGQVEARRRNHCPDIYKSPANACRPQTAPPGTSMHESGLAFDFKCDIGGSSHIINWDKQNPGFGIEPKTKKCFDWLSANSGKYGLTNLKKENWHWSTTGH